jgi:hypothetical protein
MATKIHFSADTFLLLLLSFFDTFFLFIDITTGPRLTRPLYNVFEQRAQVSSLLLTILSIFDLQWPTIAFCITVPYFSL